MKDRAGALIGGELFGAGGGGTDTFVGDLAESGDGTWKGVLSASIDQDRATMILGTNCQMHIVGSQQVDAVLTKGSFGGELNATLVLTPKVAPSYSTTDTCMPVPATKASNGIAWLYFFVSDYARGAVRLHLPDAPGGTWKHTIGDAEHSEYTRAEDECTFLEQIASCFRLTTLTVTYRS